jgi:hypothetical protein
VSGGVCPAPGCGEEIGPLQLACSRDWFRLPRPLQSAINTAWYRRSDDPLNPDLIAAHEAAKAAAGRWFTANPR